MARGHLPARSVSFEQAAAMPMAMEISAYRFKRSIRYAVREDEIESMSKDERFKSLYQKYYWRVVRYYVQAFRLSQEDAEELAQDAFIRFYQAMDEYRGDAEWAFFETIARNLGLNKIRSQRTAKRSAKLVAIDDPDFNQDPPAPQEPDLAERQYDALRRQQLRGAMAKLPNGQRECLQMWLEGFKYDEIATFLRVSIDAVKSRLRDARKHLRDRLGDGDAFPEDEA